MLSPDLTWLCEHIQEQQALRRLYIRHTVRVGNATGGYLRRALGWRYDMPEKEAAALKVRAARIVAHYVAGTGKAHEADEEIADRLMGHLMAAARMYAEADKMRGFIEADMVKRAKETPVWIWAAEVRGVGPLSLAVIIGEAGNLSNYADAGKLRKRLGLAPIANSEGVSRAPSSWAKTGGLSADEWTDAGYSPNRLGQIYGCVTVPLRNAQLVGQAKTGDGPRQAKGPYGEIYLRRNARMAIEKPHISKAHRDMDACRVMTQAFVSDLWSEWRKGAGGLLAAKPRMAVSPSVLHFSSPL